jgi:inner membrane protein
LTPQATAILLLAANAPDIDVVSAAGGSLDYLRFHRHLTHSLLMAPVMALACVAAVRLISRKPVNWKMGLLVALAGVASHLALDWTNVYGIRLLLPFSARWLRLDTTSVVDPWIWVGLLLSVIAPAMARLVGGEIGDPQRPGRTAAVCALAFLFLYNGARVVFHERALATLDSRVYAGATARRVAAFPDAVNPFRWRGLIEAESSYTLFDFNLRGEFDPMAGVVFHQAPDSAALRKAAAEEEFQRFLQFSQYPLWTAVPVSDPPEGMRIQLSDMRFGVPPRAGFSVTAVFDARLRRVDSRFSFLSPRPR